MGKYNQAYQKKLEDLLENNGYDVRYEKGNFKSGFCILEAKKVVVINKFSTLESRIQALIEIVNTLVKHGIISEEDQQSLTKRYQHKEENAETPEAEKESSK